MIAFPHCKINLGLNIIDKREDGYHNLQSIFLPIPLCDSLEIIEEKSDQLFIHGKEIDGVKANNSCLKALQILREKSIFPCVHIHLLKNIPMGAGLGGGSSDGAYTLKMLNEKFALGHSEKELAIMAMQIGSDCAFFIYNQPMLVEGRGEKLTPINISLKGYSVAVAYPKVNVSTKMAFQLLADFKKEGKQRFPVFDKIVLSKSPVNEWKNILFNDFEKVIPDLHPEIKLCKKYFYDRGAEFSLMSGSGSAVYAIYKTDSISMLKNSKFLINSQVFFIDL